MKAINKYIQEKYLIGKDTEDYVTTVNELKKKYNLLERTYTNAKYKFFRSFTLQEDLFSKFISYIKNTSKTEIKKVASKFHKNIFTNIDLRIGMDPGYMTGRTFLTYYGYAKGTSKGIFYVSFNEDNKLIVQCEDEKLYHLIIEFIDCILNYIKMRA